VFHRVDDMESMPAQRFWRFAERLAYYDGAMAGSLRLMAAERPEPVPESSAAPPIDPMAPVASPDQMEALHAHPLYGDIPGLPTIFSHSTAPLAPEGGAM
jgi:hypothetical protein